MNKVLKDLPHIGDIFALPGFFFLIIYFLQIEDRTILENLLLLFSIIGFLADILFTYMYLFFKKK
jgi:hypothetical protein